jgi:hypothetical protein
MPEVMIATPMNSGITFTMSLPAVEKIQMQYSYTRKWHGWAALLFPHELAH